MMPYQKKGKREREWMDDGGNKKEINFYTVIRLTALTL